MQVCRDLHSYSWKHNFGFNVLARTKAEGGEPVISRAVCVQAVSSERLVRNGGPVLVFDFSLFILVEFVK